MAIALVTHTATNTGTASGGTTSGVNTTGASFLVVGVSWVASGTQNTPTDSLGNTYTPLTTYSSFGPTVGLFYAANPAVGAGHTVTATGSFVFNAIFFAAFSGVATSLPFDAINGGFSNSSPASQQFGSVTPANSNSLVVALSGIDFGGVGTINSGFTITDTLAGTSDYGGGLAYLVQTTATAVNPTWSWVTAGGSVAGSNAVFKAGAGPAFVWQDGGQGQRDYLFSRPEVVSY
jgi:hypothetical protein